jgi:putative ABC transport system permease protein
MMYIQDILNAFRHAIIGTLLLVVQVAFTFAVLVNIYAMVDSYAKQIDGDTGYVDEDSLISVTLPSYDDLIADEESIGRWRSVIENDLNILRSTPGISHVTLAHGGIPFQNRMGFSNFDQIRSLEQKESAGVPATRYAADLGVVDLLGIEIIEGRDFTEADVRWVKSISMEGGPSVIITKTLADALFPEGSAVGKQVVLRGDRPLTIIGIARQAQGVYWAPFDQHAIFVAGREVFNQGYLVRLDRAQASGDFNEFKSNIIQKLSQSLEDQAVERDVSVQEMPELKKFNLGRFIMINSIVGVVAILLVLVTALGNYGQMSYTILKRTKQIGIRRALGATRRYIMNYFLIENMMISALGLMLGLLMMVGLNAIILSAMGYGQLSAKHVVISVIFMFGISIGSALIPILKAMNVPPAIATRTV